LSRALSTQGLRNTTLPQGVNRHEVKGSYHKPEKEVLNDYLKAIPSLTINDDKTTLQRQLAELTENSKEEKLCYLRRIS
jgi:hypothetical protein